MSKTPTRRAVTDEAAHLRAQLAVDEVFREAASQVDELLGSFMQAMLEKAGATPGQAVDPDPLLTVGEVAAFCRVTQDTVRDWVKSRGLRRVPSFRSIRVRRADLDAFLKRPRASSERKKADVLLARLRRQMGLGADTGRPPGQR